LPGRLKTNLTWGLRTEVNTQWGLGEKSLENPLNPLGRFYLGQKSSRKKHFWRKSKLKATEELQTAPEGGGFLVGGVTLGTSEEDQLAKKMTLDKSSSSSKESALQSWRRECQERHGGERYPMTQTSNPMKIPKGTCTRGETDISGW